MPDFARRFRDVPGLEEITSIEGTVLVDKAPPRPSTGTGSGTLYAIIEAEDGPFAKDFASEMSILEAFGSEDFRVKYGGFGYERNGVVAEDPSARIHLGEFWNGNGALKLFNVKTQRLLVGRVDTSIGEVSYSPLACIGGANGPYVIDPGDQLSLEVDGAGAALTVAFAATAATPLGVTGTFPTAFSGGEKIGITIDNLQEIVVTFSVSAQQLADVVGEINAAFGSVIASDVGNQLQFQGSILGTGGQVILRDITTGTLAILGHGTGGTTVGTGDAVDASQTTAAEAAAWISVTFANVGRAAGAELRVCSPTAGSGTILVTDTAVAGKFGLSPLDTEVAAGTHDGGTIDAGSRVTDGTTVYLTMRTLDIPANNAGPYVVKVRHALDNGTGIGASAGTVTTVTDEPDFADVVVTNPSALTAALTEPQIDAEYASAFDASLSDNLVTARANFVISARRSDSVVRKGRQNVLDAEAAGLFGRIFVSGDPLGADITSFGTRLDALGRLDGFVYSSLGLKIEIPDIAIRGTAGGVGFTEDGIITVRPDGALCTVMCIQAPEKNPGEFQRGLLDSWFEIDTFGQVTTIETYKFFRAQGGCVPRRSQALGTMFQSGVTTDTTTPSRQNIARRKMANFILNTLSELTAPFIKRLNSIEERDNLRQAHEGFLTFLFPEGNPRAQRIEGFTYRDGSPPNSPELRAAGVHQVEIEVRTLATLDNVLLLIAVGENAELNTTITT